MGNGLPMKNPIAVVVGSVPGGTLPPETERATGPFRRYESAGHVEVRGTKVPCTHVFEETCDPDDPNRRDLRVERGPFLVFQKGSPTPMVGEVVNFRSADREWSETFEVSEVIPA